MARTTKKKVKLDALDGVTDPRAPLDASALLGAARPLLIRLEADLRARAAASPAVTRALEERHEQERKAERTAESFAAWSASLATQVAAAWVLSCVFVRTLEDRGLVRQARLAGPGALDSQHLFFQLAPSLTERDYLLTVFRELATHPAAHALFDPERSLVWKLSPSAELAKELLALFRTPNADAPAFRFGQPSTRFLGDLYQDISEDVRKRYALLQTPDFVESFILDRTLEPAIERFGLADTTLIDPTCGSGHFLLGAFDRLFDHRLRAEPGLDRRVAATRALDAVYGADINPYAVAIARFRLTLSFLEKAGIAKLAEAPALPLHLVVADSLRVNPQGHQPELWQQGSVSADTWLGSSFALEDDAAARDVLFRQYAVAVGNPPYITEKDSARREVYRTMYPRTATGNFALSAPFCERFFQLTRTTGYVGQITANSFMKREFGKKLIEEYLPSINLELIVNTSGAYIPGHGTPTVLLFGTNEAAAGRDVLAVLAKRGEPTTPDEPAQGLVWSSIVEHWREVGFENDFLSVARIERERLARYPWSLGGGGATELKALLEDRALGTLGERVDAIGFVCMTRADDVYFVPRSALRRAGLADQYIVENVEGEAVRDWAITEPSTSVFPYELDDELSVTENSSVKRFLWPYRSLLWTRREPNGNHREIGLTWWEWSRFQRERFKRPLSIAFAFVATHNHFVFDRGGRAFNRTAPVLKLAADATEDEHFALLAYLNSSSACFWMKQVFFEKSSQNYVGDVRDKPERIHYEFTGTGLEKLPIPTSPPSWCRLSASLVHLGEQRTLASPANILAGASDLEEALTRMRTAAVLHASLLRRMVVIQEELDWECYVAFGLADASLLAREAHLNLEGLEAEVGHRPYLGGEPEQATLQQLWAARTAAIGASGDLQLMEQPLFKRPWLGTQGVFHRDEWTYAALAADALAKWVASRVENAFRSHIETLTLRTIQEEFPLDHLQRALVFAEVADDAREYIRRQVSRQSVPFLAAMRFTESGLGRYQEWLRLWDAQRAEDAGTAATPIMPGKYGAKDMREGSYYSLRGPLDVPKECFISYHGCESDEDGEPVYGWAGWNHLQRAQALASLYMKRKDGEGWIGERLTPMLAGVLELIPWVKQWHNDPNDEFGGLRMGDYFEQFLDSECRLHGLSHDDLRAWRPAKKSTRKPKAAKPDDTDDAPAKPKRRARAKKQPETASDGAEES